MLHLLINDGEDICVFDLVKMWDDDTGGYCISLVNLEPACILSKYVIPLIEEEDMLLDQICVNSYSCGNMDKPYVRNGALDLVYLRHIAEKDGVQLDLESFPDSTKTEELINEMEPNETVRSTFDNRNYYYILVTKAFDASAIAFHKLATTLVLRPDVKCMCNYSSFTCAAVEKLCLSDLCITKIPDIVSVVIRPKETEPPK